MSLLASSSKTHRLCTSCGEAINAILSATRAREASPVGLLQRITQQTLSCEKCSANAKPRKGFLPLL